MQIQIKQKLWIGLSGVLISCTPLFLPVVQAANVTGNGTPLSIAPLITTIYSFVIYILFLALYVLDILIDPTFILEINNSPNAPLLQIWQFSRDAVNIIFAALLIGVAIYTVVTAKLELVKANITKFVLAVILVNFSWFGPRVVLDFANVLTAAIYSVPQEVGGACTYDPGVANSGLGTGNNCWIINEIEPYDSVAANTAPNGSLAKNCLNRSSTSTSDVRYLVIGGNVCVQVTKFKDDEYAHVFQGMLINYTHVLFSGQLPTNNPTTALTPNSTPAQIGATAKFMINLFLNFALTVSLAFPIMAMAVIFIVRMLILWVTIAFMPFAFVGVLIGDKLPQEGNPIKIWTYFWQNAMLPAVLAVPITIGFIMIKVFTNPNTSLCPGGFTNPKLLKLCTPTQFDVIGVDNWMEFIWYMMAIGVVYFGFFTATKFNDIANKIGGYFKALGDFAMKAPLAMPIIPIGKSGAKMSALQGYNAFKPSKLDDILRDGRIDNDNPLNLKTKLDVNNASQVSQELSGKFGTDLKQALTDAINNPGDASSIRRVKTVLSSTLTTSDKSTLQELSKNSKAQTLGISNDINTLLSKVPDFDKK